MVVRQPEIGDVEADDKPAGWISWSVIPQPSTEPFQTVS
jgi:hypothetical protein